MGRLTKAPGNHPAAVHEPEWRPLELGAWLLLPAVLTLLAYGFTLDGFFLSDDFHFVHRASEAEDWLAASHQQYSPLQSWLRPIVHWSFWIQWHTSGLEPLGYRLFNLILHAGNCAGVAWIAGILIGTRRAGAVAGAAFALLPIHPEAVTWVSGRSDLLCTGGLLVSILAWIRFCTPAGRARHLALACLALAFALGAKEMAAAGLPLLVLISLGFFRHSLRRQWPGLVCLATVSAAYVVVRWRVLGGLGGLSSGGGESVNDRIDLPAAAHFAAKAVQLTTAPLHWDFDGLSGELIGDLPLLGWALLAIAAWRSRDRPHLWRRGVPVLLLFLCSMAPIANWAGVNGVLIGSRYLYLPSVFSCIGLGLLASRSTDGSADSSGPRRDWSVLIGLALILPLWGFQLVRMNCRWDEAATLSRQMVDELRPPKHELALQVTDPLDNHHGAYVFRNGFALAASLYTDWGPDSRHISREDWQRARLRASPELIAGNVFQRWLPARERWSTAPLAPGTARH